jgi:hypothetical protein
LRKARRECEAKVIPFLESVAHIMLHRLANYSQNKNN